MIGFLEDDFLILTMFNFFCHLFVGSFLHLVPLNMYIYIHT